MRLLRRYTELLEKYPRKVVASDWRGIVAVADSVDQLADYIESTWYRRLWYGSLSSLGLIYTDPELTRRQISHGRLS